MSVSILLYSGKALFIYIIGNVVYFIWCNERKRRKRSIDSGFEEENSMGIDKDLTKEEYGIGKLSSEIILIPGIDGDLGEGKKDSVSAGNSRDT